MGSNSGGDYLLDADSQSRLGRPDKWRRVRQQLGECVPHGRGPKWRRLPATCSRPATPSPQTPPTLIKTQPRRGPVPARIRTPKASQGASGRIPLSSNPGTVMTTSSCRLESTLCRLRAALYQWIQASTSMNSMAMGTAERLQ